MKLALIVFGGLALVAVAGVAFFVYARGVEMPEYRVVEQDGPYEVRDYPAIVVAEVTRKGARRDTLSAGFRSLAAYIFASERPGPRIAMTAPVIQQRREPIAMTAPVIQAPGAGGDWTVRFIMPSEYSLADLPAPVGEGVRLQEVPAQRRAALRFRGDASDEVMAEQEAALRDWLAGHGLQPIGPAVYAYYDGPMTPSPLRRYEVLFDVAATPSAAGGDRPAG
ncbi:SOUL family heme-binding protein [Thiococcus pfennigii]|uniref:SOUL family heme-binding protein n=1 Tax=Thiococcus pfennigii TaxID=1057 RepID=UPI001903E2A1|nr:heme-binding protein [Thiococcus pfennigii]MBK1701988.1 heme-binding protein [Thiococcus pfennigii]